MVITEYRSDIDECIAVEQTVVDDAAVEERPRDARGHCWDGLTCDHSDHGDSGTIHFIR